MNLAANPTYAFEAYADSEAVKDEADEAWAEAAWKAYAAAVQSGISPHSVNRLERGNGDARSLYKYCKFLNLKLC